MKTLDCFLEVRGRTREKVVLLADYGRLLILLTNILSVEMFIKDLSEIPVIDLSG